MTFPNRHAFIGVGTMGSLMARCLLEAGIDLTVYDLRRKRLQNHCCSMALAGRTAQNRRRRVA